MLNIVGGVALAMVLTSDHVLTAGAGSELIKVSDRLVGYGAAIGFLSAIVGGALMTLMTWFVEGAADSIGIRIVMAWIVGSLIALGTFNHAIVSTIEIVFGMRYGSAASIGDLFANLGVAVAGNLAGGLGLRHVRAADPGAGDLRRLRLRRRLSARRRACPASARPVLGLRSPG